MHFLTHEKTHSTSEKELIFSVGATAPKKQLPPYMKSLWGVDYLVIYILVHTGWEYLY